ncbi:MAG TPA: hypothetical protein VLW85_03365 [Myxococcales bacterium]|nr:hypothetical protein [Myxococcales bacterium]
MDRSLEARQWRRGFAAGVAALALSVGGQVASSAASPRESCPISARSGIAQRLYDHFAPQVRTNSVAHRVALALLGAMLHDTCS